jgi:polyisoprenyl-teichoic acid--peptidoglycan teichoic acid transferase
VTEVAPRIGRRARREAEARLSVPDMPVDYGTYLTDSPRSAPDTGSWSSPVGSGDEGPVTSYLPPAASSNTPSWYPEANSFAPPGARPPSSEYAEPPSSRYAEPPSSRYARSDANTVADVDVNHYFRAPAAPRPGPTAPPHGRAYSDDPPAARRYEPRYGGPGEPARAGGADDDGGGMRGRHATAWGQGFERVVGWTLLGSLLPGSGLVAAGRKALGWSVVASWVLLGAAGAAAVLFTDPVQFLSRNLLAHSERLAYLGGLVVLVAALWALHVIATNLALRRFATLTAFQNALSWVLVTVLVGGGVAAGVTGAQDLKLSQETLESVFSGGGSVAGGKEPDVAKADPWANVKRVNMLLIGSDSGADRTGVRTDSLIVASVDTANGNMTTLSLPRNLEHVPFPKGSPQARDYPDGFYCPDHSCLINALWQFGEEHKAQYYKGEKNPGLKATVDGVEQALGIQIDQYAMVNLRGFMQFVDAIGGLQINVQRRIPVGGKHDASGREIGVTSYIDPGRQRLNGYQSLWYARSRSDSDDFERMKRQRCVIAAAVKQAVPQTIALNITGILNAAKQNIRTSIPLAHIDAWVTLATKIKSGRQSSLAFTNSVISPGDPDFGKMHELVEDALTKAPTPTVKPTPSPTSTTKKKATTKKAAPVAENGDAVDVNAVC